MSKKCYRFFGGLLNAQAKWLNKMSEKGYRLVRTGRVLYEFEECSPDEVTYCVEFIGEKSKENATDYANFLEDMGYKVFFKNINLNYSVGKVRLRPWAEMGGRIATNATTFNRELLIVENQTTESLLNFILLMPIKKNTTAICVTHGYSCCSCLHCLPLPSILLSWVFFIGFCNSQHSIPAPNYKCPTKSQNVGTINNNQEGDNKSCRPLNCYL